MLVEVGCRRNEGVAGEGDTNGQTVSGAFGVAGSS